MFTPKLLSSSDIPGTRVIITSYGPRTGLSALQMLDIISARSQLYYRLAGKNDQGTRQYAQAQREQYDLFGRKALPVARQDRCSRPAGSTKRHMPTNDSFSAAGHRLNRGAEWMGSITPSGMRGRAQ